MIERIDASEVFAFADRLAGYPAQATTAWDQAGRASGLAIQRLAQSRIQVDTGNAKAQTTMESVSASPAGVTVVVSSRAVSGNGFPYPIVLDQGRGPVHAKPGGRLKFTGKDGRTVYVKSVAAYAGNRFFSSSVEDAGPFIDAAFSQAGERLLAWVVG